MDLDMIQAAVAAALESIAATRAGELVIRDAVSGVGLDALAKELFPGVKDDFLKSNRNFPNVLQRGVNRYVQVVTRAELNWEYSLKGDGNLERAPGVLLNGVGRDLLQAATVDALATGKVAFFPYRDSVGRVRISVLNGFLWPIFDPGDSTVVEALLQINSGLVKGKLRYEVRRYTPGLLEVFSDLEDWKKYATATPERFEQRHAPDRLPVAFRITGRDARRQPEGLASTAMPAFMDYVKARMLMSFVNELGGFEERAFYSDELFKLAKENPAHPLVTANTSVGPRKGRFLPSGDKYERLSPVDLKGFVERAQEAADNVDAALSIPPNVAGANLSGIAIQEMREGYTEMAASLCNSLGDALTEACDLAARMSPTPIEAGWAVTLAPRFTQDVAGERTAIRQDFSSGLLKKSAALSGLQGLGVKYVTEELIRDAQVEEEAVEPLGTGGT